MGETHGKHGSKGSHIFDTKIVLIKFRNCHPQATFIHKVFVKKKTYQLTNQQLCIHTKERSGLCNDLLFIETLIASKKLPSCADEIFPVGESC